MATSEPARAESQSTSDAVATTSSSGEAFATTPGTSESIRWTERLAGHRALFAPLAAGSRIGVVCESILADVAAARADSLVVWTRSPEGMTASVERYPGFDAADVDLLIAIDDVASAELDARASAEWIRTLRRMIRGGHVLFFARRPRAALEDAGYDDLLYELGFAYLGACR